VNQTIRRQLAAAVGKITARLEAAEGGQAPLGDGPEFSAGKIHFEMGERNHAITCGGIGAIHQLANKVGLVKALNTQLQILKRRRPYSDSDHVLNIAYNALCGGLVLDDIELRRNDAAFLDALGARTIPDPTTAGDYCRRFEPPDIHRLMNLANDIRVGVWKRQSPAFFKGPARIDADGTLVATTGESKEGMDLSYNGVWGYHPLVVSLANTGEPLSLDRGPDGAQLAGGERGKNGEAVRPVHCRAQVGTAMSLDRHYHHRDRSESTSDRDNPDHRREARTSHEHRAG